MQDTDIINKDLNFICASLEFEFNKMSGKKILITGGAGFLGYYLVQSIIHWNNKKKPSEKIHLTVVDNFRRGAPKWISNLENCEAFKLFSHDVTVPLPKNMPNFNFIIHAASIASPIFYRKYPIETMDANINGLRHLLDYSVVNKMNIEGFLFFSTSEIYRPFNNYGPGLNIDDGRVIPDFAKCIINQNDIVIFSDGRPTRTFCYIADAIIGYFKILIHAEPGEMFNIGIEKPEISINELADLMVNISKKLFGYEGNLINEISSDKEYLTDNPNRRCPSIKKAKEKIGFEPKITLEDGLERSLIWYNSNS